MGSGRNSHIGPNQLEAEWRPHAPRVVEKKNVINNVVFDRLYLLNLISFSSQYQKAVKKSFETPYIFSIYVRISELIPLHRKHDNEKPIQKDGKNLCTPLMGAQL